MNIACIIPARGGSKGIPNKNLIDFCGKPLLAWSILQALQSASAKYVYVSSDSEHILEVSEQYGATGIVRPIELATDTATSESALLHAIDHVEAERGKALDFVIFMQATSPLREPADIDKAVATLLKANADSLFSASILHDFCVWQREGDLLKGLTFDPFNRTLRQGRKPLYLENGSIYVFKPTVLKQNGNRLGGEITMYYMPIWKSYEIDDIEDVPICEYFFKNYLMHRWKPSQDLKGE